MDDVIERESRDLMKVKLGLHTVAGVFRGTGKVDCKAKEVVQAFFREVIHKKAILDVFDEYLAKKAQKPAYLQRHLRRMATKERKDMKNADK